MPHYNVRLIRLCKQYAALIRRIERTCEVSQAAQLDHERQDLHDEIQDLMYRDRMVNDRDSVHNLAMEIAAHE